MSEEFKNKFKQYTNGLLPEQEQQEIKQELEKLEIYQQYLDEIMIDNGEDEEKTTGAKKLIKKAKQKSILHKAIMIYVMLLVIYVILHHLSHTYLSRTSNKNIAIVDAVIHTLIPNVDISASRISRSGFFQLEQFYELERRIGNEGICLGGLTTRFRFNNLQELYIPRDAQPRDAFIVYPTSPQENSQNLEIFKHLEQLPEATMAEIYISFNQFMTVEEVFYFFENHEISLDWLAVYSGDREETGGTARIGFPYRGYSIPLQKQLYGEIPGIREIKPQYLTDEFMFALNLLAENNDIAEQFIQHSIGGRTFMGWQADFRAIYNYIDENNIQIPGVVVTGPTIELLTLRNEPWISHVHVNEVTFLNWTTLKTISRNKPEQSAVNCKFLCILRRF